MICNTTCNFYFEFSSLALLNLFPGPFSYNHKLKINNITTNLEETTPGRDSHIDPTDDPTQMDQNTASPLNKEPSIIPVVHSMLMQV